MREGPDVPPAGGSDNGPRRWRIAVPVVGLASCALASVFGIGARDDPYITFWVAEQLAKTGHLVNINGVAVEQSSSLAHVLVLAALYFVTRAPMPVLGYVVGMCGFFATVWLGARLAGRIRPGSELVTAVVIGLAFPLAYWATGELETDLASAALVWFVLSLADLLASERPGVLRIAGFVASVLLVVTVRPDTMLVAVFVSAVAFGASLLARRVDLGARLPGISVRRAGGAAAVVVLTVLALTGARELVFGSALPQPELVKAGGISWFSRGFSYVFTSFPWWMWFVFLALVLAGLWWSLAHRSVHGLVAAAGFAGGVVVICFSRGDWMGGARLLVPYLAPGFVLMVVGGSSFRTWARRGALGALVAIECVTFVMFSDGVSWLSSQYSLLVPSASTSFGADYGSAYGASYQSSDPHAPPLPWYVSWSFIETRDALFLSVATPIVRQLIAREPPGRKITVASNQAGFIFYTWANEFPGKLHFIDTESLATTAFRRCHGLFASYAGELMSIDRWAADAGKCAPALPDLYFSPSGTVGLDRYYHQVASLLLTYDRRGITETRRLETSELLAVRDGWSP